MKATLDGISGYNSQSDDQLDLALAPRGLDKDILDHDEEEDDKPGDVATKIGKIETGGGQDYGKANEGLKLLDSLPVIANANQDITSILHKLHEDQRKSK